MSITSICSKVMEHTLYSKKSILMDAQHGFRKNYSCETQLITTIEDMACNLFNSAQFDGVFLDFTKAFDKVPHQRHFLKVGYYGINSKTLQYIGSFLNDRKQSAIVEGALLIARLINRQGEVFRGFRSAKPITIPMSV